MISGGESYSLQDLDSSVMSIARSVCQNVQWDSTMPPSTGHVLQQQDGHVLQQQDGRSVAPSEYQNQPAVDRRHLDTRPKIPGVAPGQGGTNVDQHYKGWLDSYGLNEHTIRSILDNGFTSKQLFMNMSEGDVDIMDIRPLAQRRAVQKMVTPGPAPVPIPVPVRQSEVNTNPINVAAYLQPTEPSQGERMDLNPLTYLRIKQKVKHLDITDFVSSETETEQVVSTDGDHELIIKSGSRKPKLEVVKPLQWTAANLCILHELLSQGRIQHTAILEYLAYTVKICDLAENHMWGSVLLYDRAYRQLQAQYNFKWGSDTPHLATAHLRPRFMQATYNSAPSNKTFTKPSNKARNDKPGTNGSTICALYNSTSGCQRARCSFKHECLVPDCHQSHPASQHQSTGTK